MIKNPSMLSCTLEAGRNGMTERDVEVRYSVARASAATFKHASGVNFFFGYFVS